MMHGQKKNNIFFFSLTTSGCCLTVVGASAKRLEWVSIIEQETLAMRSGV